MGLGAGSALVSAETDADDGGVIFAHLGGFAEDAIGFLDGEVADGVEDPVEGEAKLAGGALAGAFETRRRWARSSGDRSCATYR
jgi:hypothetical protein